MPVQFRDYYETLGVPKTATEDEIRSAFRKLARKHHPDVAKDKKAAEEKFKEINEAYEVLGDAEKRKKYDQLGADWNRPGGFQPPPDWQRQGQQPGGGYHQWGGDGGGVQFEFDGTGFSDFFLRVRLARHPDFTVEGSDLIHEVKIEPWQAVLGADLVVPTLEGNVRLKIPPGTQGAQRFRLRERGLPGASDKRGDLYVVAQINVPKKVSDREREIWSELAKLHGD